MQTLKTAIVVVLLLTVTYSAYVALTAPPAELPRELADIIEGGDSGFTLDDIDLGISEDFATSSDLPPTLDSIGDSEADAMGFEPENGDIVSDPASPKTPTTTPPSFNIGSDFPAGDTTGSNAFDLSLPKPKSDLGTSASLSDTSSDPLSISDMSSPGNTTTPSGPPNTAGVASQTVLANAIATADRQAQQDQLREALTTLSLFYNTPSMTSDDRAALMNRLDFLAGEVIYSGRHLLEQPYRVTGGETLETVGKTLNVPWQLLGVINRINSPALVVPGQELKVVRGPFRAEVNLGRSELTLFLGELYAGRFPMTTGQDPIPETGEFSIQDKQTARTYYPLNGANIPAGDPRNPYGDVWLDLGNRVCIHGSATTPTSSGAGCIQLTPRDAKDVFGILSQGSSVSIIR